MGKDHKKGEYLLLLLMIGVLIVALVAVEMMPLPMPTSTSETKQASTGVVTAHRATRGSAATSSVIVMPTATITTMNVK
jgi:hypothetical protein